MRGMSCHVAFWTKVWFHLGGVDAFLFVSVSMRTWPSCELYLPTTSDFYGC